MMSPCGTPVTLLTLSSEKASPFNEARYCTPFSVRLSRNACSTSPASMMARAMPPIRVSSVPACGASHKVAHAHFARVRLQPARHHVQGFVPGGLYQPTVASHQRHTEAVVRVDVVHREAPLDTRHAVVEAERVVGAYFVHLVAGGAQLDCAAH